MSKKTDTVTVITRPTRTFVARLENLARQYKRQSLNQLMVEIAEMYTDMWIELEKARLDAYEQQWEKVKQTLRLPMHHAEAELDNKPQAHRKKR